MRQINLIPMAGAGSRFAQAGFTDPKPLIPVDSEPMILRAMADVPTTANTEWVFLVRTEHLAKYPISTTLQQAYPGCTIQEVAKLTDGQARTCLLAKDYINNDSALLIAACDNGMAYDHAKFHALIQDESIDAVIFTFRNNVTVERNPQAYGWVKVAEDSRTVTGVSVKQAISDTPVNDHAVVGTFWFRKGSDFVAAAEEMIANNTRINNEFYVDECVNNLVAIGKSVVVFEIDTYVCWGTPNDLAVYNYWQRYFSNHA